MFLCVSAIFHKYHKYWGKTVLGNPNTWVDVKKSKHSRLVSGEGTHVSDVNFFHNNVNTIMFVILKPGAWV